MPPVPDSKLDEIRNATSIVDLIAGYIPLKRSGRGYAAVCPFHEDKDPSLHVWPETQTWKCFGCQRGGNSFHFLMEKEGVGFLEAVRILAGDAGIELAPATPGEAKEAGERERLYEVMEWACRFFETMLRAPEGSRVIEYCKSRGITGETAKEFRLGCAPASWRGLLDAARARGLPVDLLERAGLVRMGKREPYDWFRDRLVFPIHDVRDRVIGFGGRALGDDEPKYLNSPDTALFKKGTTLYGLNLARDEVLKRRRVGIMEGYTDVLMAHQHGIRWVVAGLGTGLTRGHAATARRFADRVDLIYDADPAGQKAAERALAAFLQVEADVRVVELPGGLDPCDYLVEHGREAFLTRIEEGSEAFDFLVDRAKEQNDLATAAGRTAAIDGILSVMARIPNQVMRDLLLSRLAEAFAVAPEILLGRLKIFAGGREAISTGPEPIRHVEAEAREERLLAEAVLFRPSLARRLTREWPADRFTHPVYRRIAVQAIALAEGDGEYDPATLAGRFREPAVGEAAASMLAEGREKPDLERQFEDCLRRLKGKADLREMREALERACREGDEKKIDGLKRELFRLRSQLR